MIILVYSFIVPGLHVYSEQQFCLKIMITIICNKIHGNTTDDKLHQPKFEQIVLYYRVEYMAQ